MKRSHKVAGIILAAGASSRMGKTKQLLPFRGQTILECVVDNALKSSLHHIIVVIGHNADILEPLLTDKEVTIVRNPQFIQGQSTSIKAGLEAVTEEYDAAVFLLGDQPLVTPEIINLILDGFETSLSPIVLPVFKGKRGNPVLFSRETFQRLATLKDDCGARPLFEAYVERIFKAPVTSSAIHFDVDTEEDYRQLLSLERQ